MIATLKLKKPTPYARKKEIILTINSKEEVIYNYDDLRKYIAKYSISNKEELLQEYKKLKRGY